MAYMKRPTRITLTALVLVFLAAIAWAGAKYPEEIAAAVALYPDARVLAMQKDADGVQAVLASADAPDKIMAHYKAALTGDGWSVDQEMAAGGLDGLVLVKDDRQLTISVMANPGGEETAMITLALEAE